MKALYKSITKLSMAGLMVFALISTADAQRGGRGGGGFHGGGGGGFHGYSGGGIRGGVRGGFAGPRFYGGARIGAGFGYRGGTFYHRPWGYPSFGLRIGVLPFGYYPFFWGPNQYYYYGGVFYQPYANGGGYQVVAPPIGAEVPKLPEGASSINIDGQQFYEFNGVYYKETVNADGKKVYVVAGKDGVLNTQGDDQVDPNNGDPNNNGTVAPDNGPQMPQVGDMTDELPEGSRKISLNGKKYWVTPENIYLEQVKTNNGTSYRVVSVPNQKDDQDDQQNKDME